LRADTFRYKDADGTIKPGGTWYFFDSDKFFNAELLHKEEIVQVLSSAVPASSASESSPSIVLPFYPGLIYSGPGVFFSVNGKEYEMTEASRSALEEAVKSDAAISWRYSPGRARKYGVGAQAADAGSSITVRILDTKAQVVPDISFSVELK